MIALTGLFVAYVGTFAWLAQAPESKPSVFELPESLRRCVELDRSVQAAFLNGRYDEAERLCLESIRLLPQMAQSYYNLACSQARQGKKDQAIESLASAVERGFNQADWMQRDPDLDTLREDKRFATVVEKATQNRNRPPAPEQAAVKPCTPQSGRAIVRDDNTAWDARTGLFHVFFTPPQVPAKPKPASDANAVQDPVVTGQGAAGEKLQQWFDLGIASGNRGDFYDNHDRGHSKLSAAHFPQLTFIEFDEAAKKRRLDFGLQCNFLYNQPTLGNASLADVAPLTWRSMPRLAYTDPRLLAVLYLQYTSNHLYLYPEHHDHDPGHNGKGGYGDVYPTNTPFVVISQGSSGSDQPFLRALVCTLAAFRPEVKKQLVEQRSIAPTLQLVLRSTLRTVSTPEDYLTGKAHPSVFRAEDLDVTRMVHMAHDIVLGETPPVVRLRVREEEEGVVGKDYFEIGPREKLFDSPAVIARIACSTDHTRRMVISAEESVDPNGKPLTWHWKVLRGDADRIGIRPLNEQKSVAELSIPYHTRRPATPGSNIESNRVDIGVFVHNGRSYSAPAFVTFQFLDDEVREYSPDGRVLSVEYKSQADGGNYVDPRIRAARTWRDEYRYDAKNRITGWTRRRGVSSEDFTADGAMVVVKDAAGRPLKARTITYGLAASDKIPTLEQRPGDEVLTYEYDSADDQVGRVASREKLPAEGAAKEKAKQ